jgi:GT2 family glycosyltransferase
MNSQTDSHPGGEVTATGRVYVILLNWNGWRDTVECLESVLRLEGPEVRVVVCDNASSDSSLDHIVSWAQGHTSPEFDDPHYGYLADTPLSKPVRFAQWKPGEAIDIEAEERLTLISTGANLGFAGGCNVGLRYVMERGDAEFIWLLNNDTVVRPDAVQLLCEKMWTNPEIGFCGSTMVFYAEPNVVQCYGGYDFNDWTARVLPLTHASRADALPEEAAIERRLKYISGAAMFVRPEVLSTIGLMNEQYFLYFEEIDWATRAAGKYTLGWCARSVVYHKEGRSIGSNRSHLRRSLSSERYLSRNRIIFMMTYYPARLPVTLLWVTVVAALRLLRGDAGQAKTVLFASWGALFYRTNQVPRSG